MSFVANARVMLIGFAIAQALPLLASPLLARLFSPQAFGLQSLFVSSTSVLLVLASLRLDLAAVLAGDRREAMDIVGLGVIQAVLITLILAASLALFGSAYAGASGGAGASWMWAVAPMVMALALVQLSSGLMTWLKRFGPVSRAQVLNQVGYLACALALGYLGAPSNGLVIAKLVGQVLAAGALVLLLRAFWRELRWPPRETRGGLWARIKPFLFFNTPYSFVGVVGREVPIFAFSAVAATAAAGFYGLARTMLWAPATLLAASLSQVFYREAAEHRGTVRLEALTLGLLRTTLFATAPLFALIMAWGDSGFALAFGEEWVTAGRYAMVLALPAWLAVQTAWPERLFESVGRQGVSFAIQMSFDAVSAAIVFGAVFAGVRPMAAVTLFAVINTAFHLCYLTGMFRVAGFASSSLARALLTALLLLGGSALALGCIRMAAPDLAGLAAAVLLASVAAAFLAYRGFRGFRHLASEV